MKLQEIKIKNFRSIKDLHVVINQYTILVGCNNAGKSNVLNAIDWFLNPRALQERDFNDQEKDIEIFGIISGIDESLLQKIDENHRKRIEPYVVDNRLFVKRVLDHNNLAKKGISLFVSKDIDKEEQDIEWKKNPVGIDNAISYLFPDTIKIPAMSDAFEDSTKFATKTTMGQLVGKIIDEFKTNNEEKISKSLSEIGDIVGIEGNSRSQELTKIDDLVSKNISDIFPGINAKIHIELPSINEIFKGATLKTLENEILRDVDTLGHGTQRSIQMALIRALSEISVESNDESITTILIEEPELFLHPYAIELTRQALYKLSKTNFQILIVTHSPLMITSNDFPDIIMLKKNNEKGTYNLPTLRDEVKNLIEDHVSQAEVLFSLSNKSNLLFADKVLLVEGKTELRVLPHIYENITSRTIPSDSIALVPQDGVDNTLKSINILKSLGLIPMALTDLDFAFRGAISNGLIQNDDENIAKLKELLVELASIHNFLLDESGLPKKGNGKKASDCFKILAQDIRSEEYINNLHEILKNKCIWVWKKGSIEDHLGIKGKNESIWSRLVSDIQNRGIDQAVDDNNGLTDLVNWVREFEI